MFIPRLFITKLAGNLHGAKKKIQVVPKYLYIKHTCSHRVKVIGSTFFAHIENAKKRDGGFLWESLHNEGVVVT